MLTLTLLRHAKSDWVDAGLDDFDRPLARRGIEAAPRMGAYMRGLGLKPDLILCSGAVRTRATLALVLPELGLQAPQIRYEDELYLASAPRLLARIRGIEDGPRHVMLLGHNPGLHALALELAGKGRREDLAALGTKLPTCGLVVLELELAGWAELAPASGRLIAFMAPRRLE